jgi:DNA-binding NtrC family response regulator
VELRGATIHLADRYPQHLSDFHISELEGDGGTATRARVLVVDDERLLADTTAAILRRAGFDAKIAYDGFGALEAAASFHPDYLLTDIMMPGMNGVELAIAITKIHPRTKILLFSGQAGISEIMEESNARGFEFPLLAKPVHPSKLIEELEGLKNG